MEELRKQVLKRSLDAQYYKNYYISVNDYISILKHTVTIWEYHKLTV